MENHTRPQGKFHNEEKKVLVYKEHGITNHVQLYTFLQTSDNRNEVEARDEI